MPAPAATKNSTAGSVNLLRLPTVSLQRRRSADDNRVIILPSYQDVPETIQPAIFRGALRSSPEKADLLGNVGIIS